MSRISRDEWIAGAIATLTTYGVEALKVEPLADRLGVTKGSFYHHFSSRRELHLAMLALWEQRSTDQVIERIDQPNICAEKRLRHLVNDVFSNDLDTARLETAIRAWAASDANVAAVVSRVDERRMGFVCDILTCTGMGSSVAWRRTRMLYRALIGDFMWRAADGPGASTAELKELADLLLYGV